MVNWRHLTLAIAFALANAASATDAVRAGENGSYLWQVQDHWPAQALAGYDDAWCRIYGPPTSPDYKQCWVNNYYTRLSVPIRATK